ncbi:hypothetical protein GN956_G26915 [Arapaima gigas]
MALIQRPSALLESAGRVCISGLRHDPIDRCAQYAKRVSAVIKSSHYMGEEAQDSRTQESELLPVLKDRDQNLKIEV